MDEEEKERWMMWMCERFNINLSKNREEIDKMLSEKVEITKEPITDVDIKEVCKLIVERKDYGKK